MFIHAIPHLRWPDVLTERNSEKGRRLQVERVLPYPKWPVVPLPNLLQTIEKLKTLRSPGAIVLMQMLRSSWQQLVWMCWAREITVALAVGSNERFNVCAFPLDWTWAPN